MTLTEELGNQIYDGNSVSWWHSKAKAYSNHLALAWDALRRFGVHPDGETSLHEAISIALEAANKRADEAEESDRTHRMRLTEVSIEYAEYCCDATKTIAGLEDELTALRAKEAEGK